MHFDYKKIDFSIVRDKALIVKIILFITIFSVLIWSRFIVIPSHFVHYDDIWAPYLFSVIKGYSPSVFVDQLENYIGSPIKIFSNFLVVFFSEFESLFNFFKSLLVPVAISKTSTFAPLQFWITSITIDLETSYTYSKISYRAPSALFSVLSVYVLFRISKKFSKTEGDYVFLIGSGILTVSWMFLIYSSQGENFSAGVFAVLASILLFLNACSDENPNIKKNILFGFLLSALIFLHYQTLFLLPGLFFGLLFFFKFRVLKLIKKWWISLLIILTNILAIYLLFLKERLTWNPGVHWNAGTNKQYLFNSDYSVANFFDFLANNYFDVMQSIISFYEIDSIVSISYVSFISILILLGFLHLFRSRLRNLSIAIIFFISTLLTLIFLGKLTFSPTRHMLILLPIIALLAPIGFMKLHNLIFKNNRFGYKSVTIFVFLILFGFVQGFEMEKNKRNDLLEKIDILSIIDKYKIGYIYSYGYSQQLELNPYFRENFKGEFNGEGVNAYMKYKNKNGGEKIMLFCSVSDLCDNFITKPSELDPSTYQKNNFKLIHKIQFKSNVLNGFGSLAGSGSNNLNISIWSIIDK